MVGGNGGGAAQAAAITYTNVNDAPVLHEDYDTEYSRNKRSFEISEWKRGYAKHMEGEEDGWAERGYVLLEGEELSKHKMKLLQAALLIMDDEDKRSKFIRAVG